MGSREIGWEDLEIYIAIQQRRIRSDTVYAGWFNVVRGTKAPKRWQVVSLAGFIRRRHEAAQPEVCVPMDERRGR